MFFSVLPWEYYRLNSRLIFTKLGARLIISVRMHVSLTSVILPQILNTSWITNWKTDASHILCVTQTLFYRIFKLLLELRFPPNWNNGSNSVFWPTCDHMTDRVTQTSRIRQTGAVCNVEASSLTRRVKIFITDVPLINSSDPNRAQERKSPKFYRTSYEQSMHGAYWIQLEMLQLFEILTTWNIF